MAERADRESKTEEASPRRIEEALKKGNVPFSREVANASALLAAGLFLPVAVSLTGGWLTQSLALFLERPFDISLQSGESAVVLAWYVLKLITLAVGPLLLGFIVAGLLSSGLQNVPRLVLNRIKPELSRISPASGVSRVFGAQGRAEFAKALVKVLITAALFYFLLKAGSDRLAGYLQIRPEDLPLAVGDELARLFFAAGLCMGVIALADLVWSRFQWRSALRMSLQEVKDEQRQAEGDPMIRARQRALARERARQRMISAVPKATLVIANPTHYAVALRYVQGESAAPVVLAKGLDHLALHIRRIAEEHAIPVIEDRPLARSLYQAVKADRPIPPEFYRAIAEIILHLMSRESRRLTSPVSGKSAQLA